MRLLPRNPHLGWTPYAWLIYLPIFLFEPLNRRTSVLEWGLTLAAIALFLALYFVGHWVEGWRVALVAASIFALGVGFAPWNSGASVFVIYASAFAGRLSPPRRATATIGAMIALTWIESWALSLAPGYWIAATVFSLIVGGVNIHFNEVGRTAARLRDSQAQVEQLIRIAERERIARDLHDLLGHTLSVIALKAELAGKLLATSPERAAAEIRDVERVTRDALREVRSAVAGYRSEGLPAELARARLALEAAGVRTEYLTMPLTLQPAAEAALALAVREAVTNLIRHAGAATCRITLERRGGSAVLEVADDGRGGAREGAGSGSATGLLAMRERLAGLGGQLEIRPAAGLAEGGRGTCLAVTLPIGVQPTLAVGSPAAAATASGEARGEGQGEARGDGQGETRGEGDAEAGPEAVAAAAAAGAVPALDRRS
ncbi:MAG TPA: sensor histidine kinase [Thermoanaerobaculia bacterium]|nr:sensor histidine kinase [Thermoanaerobaculia bacterium]